MKFLFAALCVVVVSAAPANQGKKLTTVDIRRGFDAVAKNGKITRTELNALFNSFDDNGDNKVDATEFITHSSAGTGLSTDASAYVFFYEDADESGFLEQSELEKIFVNFDANGDGEVLFPEYEAVMLRLIAKLGQLKAASDKLQALYNTADADNDGKLSLAELGGIFSSADTDGDGKVSKEEFVTMWMRSSGESRPRAEALFVFMDANKDGFYAGDAERNDLIGFFDRNRDGFVDMDEFNKALLYLAARLDRLAVDTGVVG
eukprot:TRINITY_DN22257_c0_g1_i2.p1 TRINITY_DN22257_c0_g1~~TRINITY_DN22257_c0_g1_i2.p1  ORF type:complete len:262 (+),score=55.50 TRINITY_DN22257_c0_g1_i2:53-838(+)